MEINERVGGGGLESGGHWGKPTGKWKTRVQQRVKTRQSECILSFNHLCINFKNCY